MESPCSPHLFYEKVDANFQVDFRPCFQGGDFTALAGVFNAPDNFGKPVQSTVLPRERGLIFLRSNFDLLSRAVISRLLLVVPMRQTASDISIHAVLLPCPHQWRGTHGLTILLPRAVRRYRENASVLSAMRGPTVDTFLASVSGSFGRFSHLVKEHTVRERGVRKECPQ